MMTTRSYLVSFCGDVLWRASSLCDALAYVASVDPGLLWTGAAAGDWFIRQAA